MTSGERVARKKWTSETDHHRTVDPIHDGRDGRDLLLFVGGESGKSLHFKNWDTP